VDAQLGGIERGLVEVQSAFAHSEEVFRDLTQRTRRIEQFVEVMRHISEQTHVLAINAGIEAAGAGEHGRGFRVLATRVQDIAAESAASARAVSTVAAEILQRTQGMVDAMERVRASTGEFQRSFNDARSVLGGIEQTLGVLSSAVSQNAGASAARSEATEQLTRVAGQLVELTERETLVAQDLGNTTREPSTLVDVLGALSPSATGRGS